MASLDFLMSQMTDGDTATKDDLLSSMTGNSFGVVDKTDIFGDLSSMYSSVVDYRDATYSTYTGSDSFSTSLADGATSKEELLAADSGDTVTKDEALAGGDNDVGPVSKEGTFTSLTSLYGDVVDYRDSIYDSFGDWF